MAWTSILTNNVGWIALILVVGFTLWHLVIKPIMNEGKPLDYEANKKPLGEVMQEAVEDATSTEIDF